MVFFGWVYQATRRESPTEYECIRKLITKIRFPGVEADFDKLDIPAISSMSSRVVEVKTAKSAF
jgi:hypothetical protein